MCMYYLDSYWKRRAFVFCTEGDEIDQVSFSLVLRMLVLKRFERFSAISLDMLYMPDCRSSSILGLASNGIQTSSNIAWKNGSLVSDKS